MKNRANGFVILDRKGEYIRDTTDQRLNKVPGLQNHPNAKDRMVVVSSQIEEFKRMKRGGLIFDCLPPAFSLRDIEPIDLADFLPGLTAQQSNLIRDYAHVSGFYDKLLKETVFGAPDKSSWFADFDGLYDLNEPGKKLMKAFERKAKLEGRDQLTDTEREELESSGPGGTKPGVLERAAGGIRRFCNNPFFGGSARGHDILAAQSILPQIVEHLENGKQVFIDMRGQSDANYTMIAALIARSLLTENKRRADDDHIRACLILEEAHNILSEEELAKGDGGGSVFIEFAREGRSFKLGFVLVTQQPDARSIAQQVVKTIDTVVAFNMPPDDANHLQRLKQQYSGLELQISNAREFQGVAVKDGGPVFFQSSFITKKYMTFCVDGRLAKMIEKVGDAPEATPEPIGVLPTLEHRLDMLMKQRRETIHPVALATMREWKGEPPAT